MIKKDEKLICLVRKTLQEALFAMDIKDDPETMRLKVIEAHDAVNDRATQIVENFLATKVT